jgi:hypothetical protein
MRMGVAFVPAALAFIIGTAAAWAILTWTDWIAAEPWQAPLFGALAFLSVRIIAGVIEAIRRP